MKIRERQVLAIVGTWVSNGQNWNQNPESEMYKLPEHPEFVYRLSGEWTGWNKFLGLNQREKSYIENVQQDGLEDLAWKYFLALGIRPGNNTRES